jgi:hypothetical protein
MAAAEIVVGDGKISALRQRLARMATDEARAARHQDVQIVPLLWHLCIIIFLPVPC